MDSSSRNWEEHETSGSIWLQRTAQAWAAGPCWADFWCSQLTCWEVWLGPSAPTLCVLDVDGKERPCPAFPNRGQILVGVWGWEIGPVTSPHSILSGAEVGRCLVWGLSSPCHHPEVGLLIVLAQKRVLALDRADVLVDVLRLQPPRATTFLSRSLPASAPGSLSGTQGCVLSISRMQHVTLVSATFHCGGGSEMVLPVPAALLESMRSCLKRNMPTEGPEVFSCS